MSIWFIETYLYTTFNPRWIPITHYSSLILAKKQLAKYEKKYQQVRISEYRRIE